MEAEVHSFLGRGYYPDGAPMVTIGHSPGMVWVVSKWSRYKTTNTLVVDQVGRVSSVHNVIRVHSSHNVVLAEVELPERSDQVDVVVKMLIECINKAKGE